MKSSTLCWNTVRFFSRHSVPRACLWGDFFSNMVKTRDTVQAEKERRVALAPAEKDYPCILLTLVIIYLLHIIFALLWASPTRFWLCCEAIALCEWLVVWGRTCVSLKPSTPPPPNPSWAAPRPRASRCMGAIIVAVNSAAPLRPCLNRPLRMVHYGPCWLQLSWRADLCTLAWRWRDRREEWEKGD